jgi:aldose 1-epimerase
MLERLFIFGIAVVLVAAAVTAVDGAKPGVTKRNYGKTADGHTVDEFTLTAGPYTAKLITYGAAISELVVPDRRGRPTDVVLGFDDLAGWQSKGNPYFNCIVGRVANRVAKGKFTLGGREYTLAVNNGPNTLHGGIKGFDKVIWQPEEVAGRGLSVRFKYLSRDGEEGFPGSL